METIIDSVIKEQGIDKNRWRQILLQYVHKGVTTIKTSSRLLNDSIDFNSFIKIVTIEGKN